MSNESPLCNTSCDGTDGAGNARTAQPAYHVERHDEGVSLSLALPGVQRDDLRVSTTDGHVTIEGRRTNSVPENWSTRRELESPDVYKLVLRLHPDLDPSSASAKLADGILRLHFSKHEAAKPRTISVN